MLLALASLAVPRFFAFSVFETGPDGHLCAGNFYPNSSYLDNSTSSADMICQNQCLDNVNQTGSVCTAELTRKYRPVNSSATCFSSTCSPISLQWSRERWTYPRSDPWIESLSVADKRETISGGSRDHHVAELVGVASSVTR